MPFVKYGDKDGEESNWQVRQLTQRHTVGYWNCFVVCGRQFAQLTLPVASFVS